MSDNGGLDDQHRHPPPLAAPHMPRHLLQPNVPNLRATMGPLQAAESKRTAHPPTSQRHPPGRYSGCAGRHSAIHVLVQRSQSPAIRTLSPRKPTSLTRPRSLFPVTCGKVPPVRYEALTLMELLDTCDTGVQAPMGSTTVPHCKKNSPFLAIFGLFLSGPHVILPRVFPSPGPNPIFNTNPEPRSNNRKAKHNMNLAHFHLSSKVMSVQTTTESHPHLLSVVS